MPETLAQKVRAKYPGAYDDLSDQQLEAAVTKKYPGVYDDLPRMTAAPHDEPTTAENLRNTLQWGGKVVAGMLGMNAPGPVSPGREAVEHPTTTLATAALPLVAPVAAQAARAAKPAIWPTRAAAGAKFQQVMGAAKQVPVDTSKVEQIASRIWDLAGGLGKVGRGGSMPKPVSDFLKRMTDPNHGPLLYDEARDFASNLSRLSAKDWSSINPTIGAKVHEMRVALNAAAAKAAGSVGKEAEYWAAMKEYARASRRAKVVKKIGTKALKYGGAGAATAVGAGAAYRALFD